MSLKQTSHAPGHSILGDSRKYPYHTTNSFFLEFRGQRLGGGGAGSLSWRSERMDGCLYYWNLEGKQESPQRTVKSVFLKNGYFMALIINR